MKFILKFKSSHRPVKLRPIPIEQLVDERKWDPFKEKIITIIIYIITILKLQ